MLNIKDLHPLLQDKMNQFIKLCSDNKIDVVITQGFRTWEYQAGLYAQGRTSPGKVVTNCQPGWSPHNYGLAFDFAIKENNQIDWDTRNRKWGDAGKLGESLGLTWGGIWKSFPDMPHLEYLFGLTIEKLHSGVKPPNTVKILKVSDLALAGKTIKVGKDIYKLV